MNYPKKLTVCGRDKAVGMTHLYPWAVISIRNPKMDCVEFSCPNLKNILHLAFDDTKYAKDGLIAFSVDDANRTWDFILSLGDIDLLVVHCLMGLSRSPAIAAAIDAVFRGDNSYWFSQIGLDGMVPNKRVYDLMVYVARERGLGVFGG